MRILRDTLGTDPDRPGGSIEMWSKCLEDVARKGDRAQFQRLFEHFAPLIRAFAYKLSEAAYADQFAEELVQETMVKVWLKAKTFDASKSSASTWIFAVARNTRIDLIRKYARHNDAVSAEELDENTLEADDIWLQTDSSDMLDLMRQQEEEERIRRSINELPEEQINVIRSIFMDGLSHSEAAETLGLPLGTVKSRVRLALQKLKLSIEV